jgi:RNA polymerase sigma factor (sigma-70 family)
MGLGHGFWPTTKGDLMHWRRISLPLLLLTVTLAPVDARSMAPRGLASPPQMAAAAQQSASGGLTTRPPRRRREASGVAEGISAREVLLAGQYLAHGDKAASTEAKRAWEGFYDQCDSTIRRFAASRGVRGGDLDDCAQEVWADLIKRLPTFELDSSKGRFESWLYRVVANKTADLRRNSARRAERGAGSELTQVMRDPGPGPSDRIEREEACCAVRQALAEVKKDVSQESYQVLCLRQLEGWDVDRVAGELGLSASQIWAREHRMKRKLGGILAQAGEIAA